MHDHGIMIPGGISDSHDQANHQPDAVDNNDLDEDGDGEEDGEEDAEHRRRLFSDGRMGRRVSKFMIETFVWSVMCFLFLFIEGLPGLVCTHEWVG
ncbi:hypothetical protein V1515DRAFT_612235 [Lipomyces mesembrius]